MATHGLLLFNLKLQVVNFWCKYYNHTLTCSLQQLISNLKIFSQRKMHKRKKPQKFRRTSSTSKYPQFVGTVCLKSPSSTRLSNLLFHSPCFIPRCSPNRQLPMLHFHFSSFMLYYKRLQFSHIEKKKVQQNTIWQTFLEKGKSISSNK
jgi:hypothetical protein